LSHAQVVLIVAAFDTVLVALGAAALNHPPWRLSIALLAALLATLLYVLVGRLQPFVVELPRPEH
jgi:hypothetical protein